MPKPIALRVSDSATVVLCRIEAAIATYQAERKKYIEASTRTDRLVAVTSMKKALDIALRLAATVEH